MPAPRPARRTVVWGGAIGLGLLIIYVGLTVAAWIYVRHVRHVEGVTYADIALPSRWSHYEVLRGNHHIAVGLNLLAQGKLIPGFQQLRVGLARAPRHREGRLALAEIYAHTGRLDLAQTTLLDGLAFHANDRDFVTATLEFLSAQIQDGKVLALCARLLADPTLDPGIHQLAALRSGQASIFIGNYDQAENTLRQNHLADTPSGQLLMAQIEWESGYQELALIMLRQLAAEFPADEAIYIRLADYLHKTNWDEELSRRAVLNQLAHPDSVRAYLDRLRAIDRRDGPAARQKVVAETFTHFRDNASGLLALADYAATEGDITLAERVAAQFSLHAWPDDRAARLMVIEATLVAGDYAAALTRCQEFMGEPKLDPRHRQIATGLQSIAFYGVGDPVAGYTNLARLMTESDLRVESLSGIAKRLIAMGRAAPAREILAHAVKRDPRNQAALTRLIELDLDQHNLPAVAANLRHLVGMRRPSPDVLRRARIALGSDQCLFLPGRAEVLTLVQNILAR
ncbi:MAG: hypothetical protein IT582_11525 [Opitutaceae bacterium]|nr:hypothetical protein [Opitutaceae bacterium]